MYPGPTTYPGSTTYPGTQPVGSMKPKPRQTATMRRK